jgi:hypothetical protein
MRITPCENDHLTSVHLDWITTANQAGVAASFSHDMIGDKMARTWPNEWQDHVARALLCDPGRLSGDIEEHRACHSDCFQDIG